MTEKQVEIGNNMRITLSNGMSYKAEKDGTVTVTDTKKVKFNHDKFAEFDKWFAKLEKKYNKEQLDKHY